MALSDLAVFSEYAYTSMVEVLAQQIELFNDASQNSMLLRSVKHQGDFSDSTFWKEMANLVRRRNAYGAGAVGSIDLLMGVETLVKVAAGTPPVNVPPSQFRWIQHNPEEGGAVYGQQLAQAMLADMLNTGILAGVAALSGNTGVFLDASAADTDFSTLLDGAALFGDSSNNISAWVMHSKSMFDIFGTALANSDRLFVFGTVNVRQDGFGRPFVVTDSPSLIDVTPNPDKHYILGLVPGAIQVDQNDDFDQNISTLNGDENIARTIQSEWSYNLGVKGYAWDKTSGGKSPTNAAIGTAANWDQEATDDKNTAGVLLLVK